MDSGLKEAKSILKSLVISCPQGITIEKLNKDYRETVGNTIPYARLGYPNLEMFLKSLTDTLMVRGSGPTAKVGVITDEKTQHLQNMIMKQKNATRERRNLTVSKKPQKPTPAPPLLSLPSVVTINKPAVYYTTQYNKPIYHPQLNWVTVPCTSYYNYSQYTSPTSYHWNIPPNQLTQQITDMHNQLNKLHIYSKPNVKTTTTESKSYNHQSVKHSPVTSPITFNTPNHQPNITKIQHHRVEVPRATAENKSEENKQIENGQFEENKQNGTSKVLEGLWFEQEPTKPAGVIPKKALNRGKEISFQIQKPQLPSPNNVFNGQKPKRSISKNTSKVNGQISRQVTSKKAPNFNRENCSSSDAEVCSESSGALRNVSTDLDDTKDSKEKKNSDNEAIPELAHNDIVFLLDYPTGSVTFGQKIQPSELPSEILVNSWFGIFITEIHNPYKFWFHVYKENNELDSLMQDIENFYKKLSINQFQIQVSNIKPGQFCCAKFLDMWHRAEILEDPSEEEVKLLFVDYGTVAKVPIIDVKYLMHEFSTLRCQALRGSLAYIKPITHRWSRDATFAFLDMVMDLYLYAKATEINEKERTVHMIITDTNDDRDFRINEALVTKGYAKFCEEDYNRAQQGQPLNKKNRHFQEKYPTFEMLESGEYPSFNEIGLLLAKGIDFEAREDENILPDVDENCSLEEITKELTTFNISQVSSSEPILEDIDEMTTTPDNVSESNENDLEIIEPKAEEKLQSNTYVLNPFTNPFVPKSHNSSFENSISNQLGVASQFSNEQLIQMPSHQLQQNPFNITPVNMSIMSNNTQYYNTTPPYYDVRSNMPATQTIPVQTGPIYTSNWNQFTNIFNHSQEWSQNRPSTAPRIPPGFENTIHQPANNLFYFR